MTSIFTHLHPKIQSILTHQSISTPTEPQIKAIPPILQGKNTLLIAPTGLGKTEAAIIPVFQNFLHHNTTNTPFSKERGISILYITPLRALNRDMLRRTLKWGKALDIKVAVRHGDTPDSERAKQSRSPPDMLITTPETLQILFIGKRLRTHLEKVRWVIVDEIHELVADERGTQLAVALERLEEITTQKNHSFQRIGISATIGDPQKVATFLGGIQHGTQRSVEIVEVDVTKHLKLTVELPQIKNQDIETAKNLRIEPISAALIRSCKQHIDNHISTLLFINTRDGAEIITSRFHQRYPTFPISVHHGSLSKQVRIESENDFKQGKLKSLVCTSSLELGIDVGNTDYVIQYNSPRQVTRLIQRLGRSGHQMGKTSEGLVLASSVEDYAESIVIARRALEGTVEKNQIRATPLSVLTNQIISITLEYGNINSDKVYYILTRAYPFQNLSKQTYQETLAQIKNQRSIWFEDQNTQLYLGKRRQSRTYFLDNISMIPDEKSYPVIDIGSRQKIGRLDESFVLSAGFEGEKIILKGQPWMIVKQEDDQILVTSIKDIGEAPSWIGEDIPVPFEIAQEVGAIRRQATQNQIFTNYPTNHESYQQFVDLIHTQTSQGFILPTDRCITIESDQRNIIINACFGTKVNETLGRIIAALLVQNIGESIGINTDPYRIMLELPGKLPAQKIQEILLTIDPQNLDYLLKTILKNSTYIRWQLVHVARKYGALRKDFDYKNIGIKRLQSIFRNTQIMNESLNKLIWDRMDLLHTKQIITDIQQGNIQLHIQPISPIGSQGFETIRGLMVPQRADRTILTSLKKRLEDTKISLICTNCHHNWDTVLRRTPTNLHCSKCNAKKIIILKRHEKDLRKYLTKKHPSQEDYKYIRRLNKNASLVLSYGYPAMLTLLARGIGPDTTARILRNFDRHTLNKSENEIINLLREILRAEIHYARTRGFWDS